MNKQYLIIGAVSVLVLLGGAFAMMNRGGGDSVSSAVSDGVAKLFNAECRYNDAPLCKFMNNWKMPSEYAMHSTMTAKGTAKMEFESKVKGDDSHTIMKEAGKVTHESIVLSGVDYQKDLTDGVWWKIAKEKVSAEPIEDMVKIDYDFNEKMEEVEDKTTYVRIGVEACGGAQCYKYQILDPENKTTKEFIWFDDKEYLMRKMRSEEIAGEMSISEIETTYGNVTITTPSPVKEGTALDAYGASSGMSKAEIADLKKQQAEAEKAAAEYMKSVNTGGMNGQAEMTWEMPPEEAPSYPPQEEVAY